MRVALAESLGARVVHMTWGTGSKSRDSNAEYETGRKASRRTVSGALLGCHVSRLPQVFRQINPAGPGELHPVLVQQFVLPVPVRG